MTDAEVTRTLVAILTAARNDWRDEAVDILYGLTEDDCKQVLRAALSALLTNLNRTGTLDSAIAALQVAADRFEA